MPHIVVVVGMPASGKNFARFYAEENRIPYLSTGDMVRVECASRGLDLNAKNLAMISDELRSKDPAELTRWLIDRVKKELSHEPVVMLEGMRSWEEIEVVRYSFPTTVVAFVVGLPTRRRRFISRGREDDDPKFFDERDRREIEYGTTVPIAMADRYVMNEGEIEDTVLKFRRIMEDILETT
ncbi:MAG: AAA family ATPase [Candidatus Thermoplasmatota archaeon]|nr:AAA family ATPase [Candidatus Thermoplasmatota archaeon]